LCGQKAADTMLLLLLLLLHLLSSSLSSSEKTRTTNYMHIKWWIQRWWLKSHPLQRKRIGGHIHIQKYTHAGPSSSFS
jgi:hypothetical protein